LVGALGERGLEKLTHDVSGESETIRDGGDGFGATDYLEMILVTFAFVSEKNAFESQPTSKFLRFDFSLQNRKSVDHLVVSWDFIIASSRRAVNEREARVFALHLMYENFIRYSNVVQSSNS
jgi:hypothetical protein